jgi:hypothetical protein
MHSPERRFVQAGVQLAAFKAKLDTIAVFRTSRQAEAEMFGKANPPVLSVIAYACATNLCRLYQPGLNA